MGRNKEIYLLPASLSVINIELNLSLQVLNANLHFPCCDKLQVHSELCDDPCNGPINEMR